MKNVLITGANGFVGSNLMNLLENEPEIKLFSGTRNTINLYAIESTREFIKRNEITVVIHCAIQGGNRNVVDSPEIVYNNLLMYENLLNSTKKNDLFINISSGAEFDRKYNIENANPSNMPYCVPTDYYGFSKKIIAAKNILYQYNMNLRLFGCFYHNEVSTRFIKSSIEKYLKNEPIVIHQDKYMDFFYMEDLATIIKYFLKKAIKNNLNYREHDINMSYHKKYKLSDIANIINNLSSKKVNINIQNEDFKHNYTGDSYVLDIINSNNNFLKGLEVGIQECYEKIK